MLDARINNRYEPHSLLRKFFTERLWIRKTISIPGEHAIILHVVDIEMKHVERQIALAIFADNFFRHRIGIIAPATLLVPERPNGWHWHTSGEFCVTTQDFLERRAIEKIIVQLTAFGPKPNALLRRLTEVEIAAIAVVEKNAIGTATLQAGVERYGLIDWISAFEIARRIGIPIHK